MNLKVICIFLHSLIVTIGVPMDSSKIEFRPIANINFNTIVASGYIKDPEGHRMFLYVGRKVDEDGDVVCGEYIPKARLFYWSHMDEIGRSPSTNEGLEVLYYPRGSVTWVPEDHPLKPAYLPISCGRHSKIEKRRYFCRGMINGSLPVGVKEEGSNICIVTLDNTLLELKTFEVLIQSEYGKMMSSYVDESDDHFDDKDLQPCWLSLSNFKRHGAKALGYEWNGGEMLEYYAALFTPKNSKNYAVGKYSLKSSDFKGSYNFQGKVYSSDDLALLDFPQGTLSWVTNKKDVRTSAHKFMVGTFKEVALYICRAKLDGNLVLGQYIAEKRICQVAYKGKPESVKDNEVLVINDYGKSLGVTSSITHCTESKPKSRIWGGRALFL